MYSSRPLLSPLLRPMHATKRKDILLQQKREISDPDEFVLMYSFDMCMKTAQLAVDSCHNSKSSACACSAGKQLLACYAECPEDPKMFGTYPWYWA